MKKLMMFAIIFTGFISVFALPAGLNQNQMDRIRANFRTQVDYMEDNYLIHDGSSTSVWYLNFQLSVFVINNDVHATPAQMYDCLRNGTTLLGLKKNFLTLTSDYDYGYAENFKNWVTNTFNYHIW